jgi:hypothetical protein
MKNRNWMILSLLFLFGFAVMSGGCGVAEDIAEKFIPDDEFFPDGGEVNGVWRSSGNPDITISGFSFRESDYVATANVTIGVRNLGSLRFESNDDYYYVYNGGPDRYMSVAIGSSYSVCWVSARFSAQGISISNAEYTKGSGSGNTPSFPVNPPFDDPNNNPALPLTITPASLVMNIGDIQELTAYNVKGALTWMGQNQSVAVYPMEDSTTAKVVAIALGETDIFVSDTSGATALCHVIVTE